MGFVKSEMRECGRHIKTIMYAAFFGSGLITL